MTTKTKKPMKISNTGLRRVTGGATAASTSSPADLARFNRQLAQQLSGSVAAAGSDQHYNPPASEKK